MRPGDEPSFTECEMCGACCAEMGRPPYELGELEALPEDLRRIVRLRQRLASPGDTGLPCYLWDAATKRCTQYEHRPKICREHEAGGASCRSWRTRDAMPRKGRPGVTDMQTFNTENLTIPEARVVAAAVNRGEAVLIDGGRRVAPLSPVKPRDKVGRNAPCPCGSGRKYKKCHGRRAI